jgi:hypothetical protein
MKHFERGFLAGIQNSKVFSQMFFSRFLITHSKRFDLNQARQNLPSPVVNLVGELSRSLRGSDGLIINFHIY